MNKTALSQLDGFSGTEGYHRFSVLFPNLVLTDGVKFFAENAGCFWWLDIIGSYQNLAKKDASLQGLQFWSLKPYPQPEKHPVGTVGHMMSSLGKLPAPKPEIKTLGGILHHEKCEGHPRAFVVCDRDSNDAAIVQDIGGTDFPFDAVPEPRIWVAPTDGPNGKPLLVAMLPSEY
jgi:hypothetical protein